MRIKLTAKHPRPASSERAPVRPGSASARKPTRPARPQPPLAESGAPRERAAADGAAKRSAGGKPAGSGARATRAEGPSFARERSTNATGAPRRPAGAGERGERVSRRTDGERGSSREGVGRAPRRFEGSGERGERAERAPRRFEGAGERSERAPRRETGERAERAPRRFEGAGERSDRAPRREAGERAERAPRRFEGTSERGERAPRRETGERAERAPRRFEGTGERNERATRRFEGSADRGDRAPRGFGDRPPRRDDGERRPFSGPRAGAGRPSEGGMRGDRPVRGERNAADRPRFGSDRGAPQERRGAERRARDGDSAPRRFEGERGERAFAKPVKGSYSERSDRAERPARAPRRDERDDRNARGNWTPDKREPGERPARRGEAAGRPARGFDKPLPAAARRARDERPARAGKPHAAASAAPRRDAEIDAPHDTPRAPRRDREDAPGMLRLSKLMSKLGLCSRREADEWIEKGWVMVDGERVDTLGTKVFPDQRIDIDPAAEAAQSSRVTVLIHKPVGLVSGQAEDGYQPAITLVTPENRWEGDRSGIPFAVSHLRQLAPAGRLDIDSTGLLVLTQDGRIAKQLIGGHSDVDKEYLVRVAYGEHTVDVESHFPAESLALLRHGLSLDDVPLKPAEVSWQNGEQLRFVLREGKKRQIRRMCELVGLEVVGLKRVRMGRVVLGALPPGQWRYLSEDEAF
ncbi:MAG: pseudouridine synthase [Paraburkholderia sp.]